ncbi:metal-dependent hydrolase [Haloarchaeobius sp. TZWWS8]|uniref:metal-dependent hydrolase n=1 Tax=Haloarchaeobius sp. TZWWS8 TaxID=3446121 RepID=UPI003EBCDE61
MYIGHGLLGFALGGLLSRRLTATRSRALSLAFLAGGFGMVPDVDLAYTLYVVVQVGPQNLFPTTEHVWAQAGSWAVHRALTHSLVVGLLGAGFVCLLGAVRAGTDRTRQALSGIGLLVVVGLLYAIVLSSHERLGAVTITLYLLACSGLTVAGLRRAVPSRLIALAAAVGLLSHPFGDFFMGSPPTLLYPLSSVGPESKLALASDPTVNLVLLFSLEVVLAWAAIWTYLSLRGRRLGEFVTSRAVLGTGFAVAALYIQPPTLDLAYHFALGAIGTGLVIGAVPSLATSDGIDRETALRGLGTSLATVTFALGGYLVGYVLLTP